MAAGVAPQKCSRSRCFSISLSSIAARKFQRAGYFRWRLFWPFAIVSIPMAFVGGAITLPGQMYKILVGLVLLYAAWQLWLSARAGERSARCATLARLGDGDRRGDGTARGTGRRRRRVSFLKPVAVDAGVGGSEADFRRCCAFHSSQLACRARRGFAARVAALPEHAWVFALAVLIGGWFGAEYGSKRFANPIVRRFLAVVLAVAGTKMVLVWVLRMKTIGFAGWSGAEKPR